MHNKSLPEALEFEVNDISIAAQRWHNGDKQRLLCLHGWLDNSESFALLAPLLSHCDVVAFDMAGHGLSSHRSAHGSYNIWDDFIDIQAIANELGWKNYYLLGHSRGAIAGFLYTASMPQAVSGAIFLDGLFPPQHQPCSPAQQLHRFLSQRERQLNKPCRYFESVQSALETRSMLAPIDLQAALAIVQRDLIELPEGLSYRHDPRLKAASAVRFTLAQLEEFLQDIKSPCLLLKAKDGELNSTAMNQLLTNYPLIETHIIDGCHHFHLQKSVLTEVVSKILLWLER